jgi:thiosulfate/3-mercaptopyruvate sulfurtransferase
LFEEETNVSDRSNAAHHEMLVTTDWLESRLYAPGLRIVDTRKGDGYAASHIAGAVAYGGGPFLRENGDVIGPEHFAALMSRLGIGNDTLIVAYDDGNNLFAARLWWVLNYYGHAQVRVLDGGWDLWAAEGRPVDGASVTPDPARFDTRRDDSWIADTDYLRASIGHPQRIILDVRGDEEWSRIDQTGATRPGHIPSAAHLVWTDVIDPKTKRFVSDGALRRLFRGVGATPDKEVITYCHGGIRAAHSMLALKLAGFSQVRNYEGSWVAWSASGYPIEPFSAPTSRAGE